MIEIAEPFNNINILTEDIYQYCEVKNVSNIKSQYNKYIIEFDENNSNEDISYYFNLDTLHHDAFAHWVFESAIYLPLFIKLKTKYPSLKIYSTEFKNYKKLFYNYFDVNENDIVYNLQNSNVCIFPLPISSLNINILDNNWRLHIDYFITKINLSCTNNKHTHQIFLPRQNKENYKNNDRSYNTIDIINHIQNNNGIILNTDEIIDLREQIHQVNSSSNVILTGGSPYLVNGLFCKNSSIIVLDDFVIDQIKYIKMKYIHDKICENNKVSFIKNIRNGMFDYNDITPFLI
jgi:hypothetical protein